MLIMILFHDSGYRCLKHFYMEKVCKHLRHLFPKVFSYNRFSVADEVLLRKRTIIETVNNELKNIAHIEHSRHRCFDNFIVNMLGALAAYCYFPKKAVHPCFKNYRHTAFTILISSNSRYFSIFLSVARSHAS